MLAPDGLERFSIPPEFANEDIMCYEDETEVKVHITDAHIWWFRE